MNRPSLRRSRSTRRGSSATSCSTRPHRTPPRRRRGRSTICTCAEYASFQRCTTRRSTIRGSPPWSTSRPGGPEPSFVHCGALSIGVRKKLGLPSRFDLRLGDPLGVARLAAAFPTVPFVIPHFGAGLFREALMAVDAAPNVYLDTSSSNAWMRFTPGLTLDEVFRTSVAVAGASRLLFGTDSSFFPRGWQAGVHTAQRQAVERLGLSAADQSLIFGGNFDRLVPHRGAHASRL
jgi:hypothetical protein